MPAPLPTKDNMTAPLKFSSLCFENEKKMAKEW